jgi:hypothetical protein
LTSGEDLTFSELFVNYHKTLANPASSEADCEFAEKQLLYFFSPSLLLEQLHENVSVDTSTGKVMVEIDGTQTTLPDTLGKITRTLYKDKRIKDFESVLKFWTKLVRNPTVELRDRLFDFTHYCQNQITLDGNFIGYKAVARVVVRDKEKFNEQLANIVNVLDEADAKKCVLAYEARYEELICTMHESLVSPEHYLLGTVWDIHSRIAGKTYNYSVGYTDIYSGRTTIQLNRVVSMSRNECDEDPFEACSSGLHVGSFRYAMDYSNCLSNPNHAMLEVLVSPTDVVAVPEYCAEKLRTARYLPVAEIGVDSPPASVYINHREFSHLL